MLVGLPNIAVASGLKCDVFSGVVANFGRCEHTHGASELVRECIDGGGWLHLGRRLGRHRILAGAGAAAGGGLQRAAHGEVKLHCWRQCAACDAVCSSWWGSLTWWVVGGSGMLELAAGGAAAAAGTAEKRDMARSGVSMCRFFCRTRSNCVSGHRSRLKATIAKSPCALMMGKYLMDDAGGVVAGFGAVVQLVVAGATSKLLAVRLPTSLKCSQ